MRKVLVGNMNRRVKLERERKNFKSRECCYMQMMLYERELDERKKLQDIVKEEGRVCKWRKMQVKGNKSKVMVFQRGGESGCGSWLLGETLAWPGNFK